MKDIDVIKIGKYILLVLVLLVVWKLVQKFNLLRLGKSEEQEKEEEATSLNLNIEFKEYTSPNFWKLPPPKNYKVVLFNIASTDDICKGIYDSIAWTSTAILTAGIIQDDEQKMLANIKKIKYKTQFSWVADRFQKLYGIDLVATLKKYFNDEELYPAWKYLEKLPTYAKA